MGISQSLLTVKADLSLPSTPYTHTGKNRDSTAKGTAREVKLLWRDRTKSI